MHSSFWLCAHRGASGTAPENTLTAMERARLLGANSIELDVHLSSDGVPVVLHDDTLDRTTNGSGAVAQKTLEQLHRLDAGAWFAPRFAGERIPTLTKVLRWANGRLRLNIEIKSSADEPGIAAIVVDEIRQQDAIDHCIVTSFDRPTIAAVKSIAPEIAVGWIAAKKHAELFKGEWDVLSCHFSLVDAAFVAEARRSGKRLMVWTVNEIEEMQRLLDLQVDGIITNFPERLQKICTNAKNQSNTRNSS